MMIVWALIGIAAILLLLWLGRALVRALRVFVKNCWPQS